MNFNDCTQFANEIKTCFIATAEGDQPRVRPIGLWYADEKGFYIQTQSVKAFAKQMLKNPKIEICFFSRGEGPGKDRLLRVYGKVKPITDPAMLAKCIKERAFLKGLGIDRPDNPLLAVFHLYTGECYFWTGADSMKEALIPRIKF
jgi:pyridoxamine 5'-phosphate oxidase